MGRLLRGRLWPAPVLALAAFTLFTGCAGDGGSEGMTASASPQRTLRPSRSAAPTVTLQATEAPSPTPAPVIPTPSPPATPDPPPRPDSTPAPPPAGDLLTVVDKQTALPADYVPQGLVSVGPGYIAPGFSGRMQADAYEALTRMLSDAYDAGNDIYVRSAYRSYSEQATTFAYWVSVLGEAEARRVSAEPGHSEHQLGTTADLTDASVGFDLVESFGASASGQWLMVNAHLYGFALSYPAGVEHITGYAYEPWHWRYIGPDHATAWKASGLTLLEYLRAVR